MIIKLERYNEIGELLEETRTTGLSGRRPEGICNYGGCPHGGGRDGDVNRDVCRPKDVQTVLFTTFESCPACQACFQ